MPNQPMPGEGSSRLKVRQFGGRHGGVKLNDLVFSNALPVEGIFLKDTGDFRLAAGLGENNTADARLLASRHQEMPGCVVALQKLTMFNQKTIHFRQRLAIAR